MGRSGVEAAAKEDATHGPLTGMRVLEIGHFIAAPFCTRVLADLGADVIKLEPPGGDPIRQWGLNVEGRSAWWSAHARNKRCITVDLKHARAPALVLELVKSCDAVVENFRPGQLAKLGIGPDEMRRARPDLVIAHVSGYGQTGPDRDRAAFGVIGEAIGGLRHLCNHPEGMTDLPPVRVGVSIGDSIAGLYAALGVVASLWRRDRAGGDLAPRTLDVALTEAVLSMTEGMLPEYGLFGAVRQPTGSRIPTASPSSAYPTRDGKWVLIAANSEPLFARLATLMGQPEIVRDPRFTTNRKRVENVEALDCLIGAWTSGLEATEAVRRLTDADVPCTLIYTAADCAADRQFRDRGMIREVADPGFHQPVLQPGIVPHVVESPGAIRWPGPPVGAHTDEVLRELLDYGQGEIEALRREGVV